MQELSTHKKWDRPQFLRQESELSDIVRMSIDCFGLLCRSWKGLQSKLNLVYRQRGCISLFYVSLKFSSEQTYSPTQQVNSLRANRPSVACSSTLSTSTTLFSILFICYFSYYVILFLRLLPSSIFFFKCLFYFYFSCIPSSSFHIILHISASLLPCLRFLPLQRLPFIMQ